MTVNVLLYSFFQLRTQLSSPIGGEEVLVLANLWITQSADKFVYRVEEVSASSSC